jgi:tRNA threonylcarbamoyladenosine modification (KEOPS) complex Cgi121 subunit
MQLYECSSKIDDINKLIKLGRLLKVIFLEPGKIATKKEIEAAFFFAKKAMEKKQNISNNIENEVLLFLSRKTNFSSAIKEIGIKNTKKFLILCARRITKKKLKESLLLEKIKKITLPKFGKKIGGYSQAEIAIEAMALSRIKN